MRIELLTTLAPDPLVAGRIVGQEARRIERVVRGVERVGEPGHPAQERAPAGLAGQRPETATGEPLDEVEQDGARLVDELVAVAEGRDAPQRVDGVELGRLVAPPWVDVHRLVLGARLLESGPRSEAARARDLEELEHAPTLAIRSRAGPHNPEPAQLTRPRSGAPLRR